MNATYSTNSTVTPASSHTATTGNNITAVHNVSGNDINSDPSIGLVIGLVVVALVMLAVVALGLVLLKRKRRQRVSETMRNHNHANSTNLPTERSTWHDDTADKAEIEEDTFGDHEIRVDNIELQPTFSISGHHLMMDDETLDNADNGGSNDAVKRDTQQSIKKKQVNDRESVVFDSKSKSFKVRDNVTHSQNDTISKNGKQQVERYQKGGKEYTFVDKVSKAENGNKTTNAPNYELATAVTREDGVTASLDDSQNSNTETKFVIGEPLTEDSDYVPMHELDDDIYANYESVRLSKASFTAGQTNGNWKRNNSMVSTMDHEVETNSSPRRTASEKIRNLAGGEIRTTKRPMPQPRLSKKKIFDPYDYPPGFPISPRNSNTSDTKCGSFERDSYVSPDKDVHDPVNTDIVDNVVDDQEEIYDYPGNNEAVCDGNVEEEEIYDYPRNNEAVCDGNVEKEQDEIYDNPTNNGTVCDGSVEEEQDEDRIYAVPRSVAIDS